jgi:hypothetical protein
LLRELLVVLSGLGVEIDLRVYTVGGGRGAGGKQEKEERKEAVDG